MGAVPTDVARDCIFCKIVRREAPAGVVAEDDAAIAFLDIMPINPGHTLVIPKAHAAHLGELAEAVGGKVFAMAMAVASALRRSGLRCDAVNLYLADGRVAGQEVPHVHLHVIPRYAGDGHHLRLGAHYGRPLGEAERDATATNIRRAIATSAAG